MAVLQCLQCELQRIRDIGTELLVQKLFKSLVCTVDRSQHLDATMV